MKKETAVRTAALLKQIEEGELAPLDLDLEGFSGKKVIACLQHLAPLFCKNGSVYLEIGVYKGLTLLSAAQKNKKTLCFGIDNFALFDEEGKNLEIINSNAKRLGIQNAKVIDCDFETALDSLEKYIGRKKVGVFFVDGSHDYRSQLMALLKITPFLAEECAIVIDDSNYPHVRQANNDFLRTRPDFALLLEAYTRKHPANMDYEERKMALAGWWNGVNVIVRDPEGIVKRNYAQEESKNLHFVSHDLFRHELAGIAFDVLKLVQVLDKEADASEKLKALLNEYRKKNPSLYPHQNTFSRDLPNFVLHPAD